MKLPAPIRRAPSGVALVLVLGCLVLLSVLVVAFLASVKSEVSSSSGYASSSDVKQRSQAAVNMVIAQIQEASSGTDTAWTSQPGLVRTYSGSGSPLNSFKLYSSGTMVADSAFDPNTAVEVPSDWKDRPSEYTDLNQPVLVADPSGPISKGSLAYTPNYPILDPGALGTVKGFAINGGTAPPNYASVDPITNNPAPMPVQWLYVLEDGSVREMNPATKQVAGATQDNPIVSRMAFWTDDETCKVNINTAAGDEWDNETAPGSFMDTPRARNDFENKLKETQPVNHEYQRYPGHPATTYLSAVFPALTRAEIGTIIPRILAGGSEGGTKNTYSGNSTTVAALAFSDGSPLYASVDELRYIRSTSARSTSLFTPSQIEWSKFFLTANSRAPEVNLYNKPRISLWPQGVSTTTRTAFDKAIAFCSTIAGQPFYFTRYDANSATADFTGRNVELYQYLKDLTDLPVPGFGGRFSQKYPSPGPTIPSERDQILTEIFDYSRSAINLIDSGSGAVVYAGPKVSNMKVHTTGGPGQVVPIRIGDTMGFGRTSTLYEPFLHINAINTFVDPAALTFYDKWDMTYSGTGDNILRGKFKPGSPGSKHENANLARLFTTKVQVAILFNTYSVAHGTVRFVPNLIFEVSGLDTLRIGGNPVDFGASTASTSMGRWAKNHEYAWGSYSSPADLFWVRGADSTKTWGTSDPTSQYPFVSKAVTLASPSEAKSPLDLESGDMTLNIYAATSAGAKGDLIQTIHLKFPKTTVPTPYVAASYVRSFNGQDTSPQFNDDPIVKSASILETDYFNFLDAQMFPYSTSYGETDIKKAVVRTSTRGLGAFGVRGDMRLVAAKHEVPVTTFTKLPGYEAKSAVIVSSTVAPGAPPPPTYDYGYWYRFSLDTDPDNPKSDGMISGSERAGNKGGNATYAGSLVTGVNYDKNINASNTNSGPGVSWGITSASLNGSGGSLAPGDWDTGMGGISDGAYINKADEGEIGANAYSSHDYAQSNSTQFSPNRQVPSPVVLGSLSTGVIRGYPWQTLLFCPNPAAKSQHPGLASPPDHLFLDLFNMPVVEPYAISEPFSTAGKINLNAQIVPFTNIERTTGLQAVLRSVRVAAIPTAAGLVYKSGSAPNTTPYRIPVDIDETLKAFQTRYTDNHPFRSASEICDMFLVPKGVGANISNIANWWDNYALTGDNLREQPYSHLYPRLTTKSNTYTVHVRTQTLKKVDRNKPGEWIEGKDKVSGEYRGSFVIERYLDPNLDSYNVSQPLTAYKFRTLSTKHFTP